MSVLCYTLCSTLHELILPQAQVLAFRDATLRQKPVLLHSLLTRALASDQMFDKASKYSQILQYSLITIQFAPVCVSMLSTALAVAVPVSVRFFLEKLIDKTIQSRSSEAIKSVHQIISGLGPSYLDDLSADVIARFQDHLTGMLSKLDMNDTFSNLLCLAILAKFASRSPDWSTKNSLTSKPSNITIFPRQTNESSAARKYFIDNRAPKTFDLAVLKAINACSHNSNLRHSEALEILMLSGEIISMVSLEDRRIRIDKNRGMIKNLHGKILRPDIDANLQSAVCPSL